jgi:hypothetical protein
VYGSLSHMNWSVHRQGSEPASEALQKSRCISSSVSLCPADDEFGEKTVSVLLDGEESEMIFIDHPSAEMSVSVPCFTRNRARWCQNITKLS